METPKLSITVQGSVIDHLGIQMYQSPASAVSELIANAWDADAKNVIVNVKDFNTTNKIEIIDDGNGMTAEECQSRFLAVGACRRKDGNDKSDRLRRPVLGKKGIGKFAGFGVAQVMIIDTTSIVTGERTRFLLKLAELRAVEIGHREITVLEYEPPNQENKKNHGTYIELSEIHTQKTIQFDRFLRSVSRKFSLQRISSDFQITIDDTIVPDGFNIPEVQFDYPIDYQEEEKPGTLIITDGWGEETLPKGNKVRWRFLFCNNPISDEELKGISIFCRGKMAQKPFFFNLAGGLYGQHGLEYLTGRVEADYIDEFSEDLISPERQRIDFENDVTADLENWGKDKVKSLIAIWKKRRIELKIKKIQDKILPFTKRILNFPAHEQKTINTALMKIAEIETIEEEQLETICGSMVTAWEAGRLKELIHDLSEVEEPNSDSILSLFAEAEVLTALNTAEVIKTKLASIEVLEQAVEKQLLENKLRDHVAAHPYIIDPRWDTYKIETSLRYLLDEAEDTSKRDSSELNDRKRVDLLFKGGTNLLVIEFMRPGLKCDRDHLERLEAYIDYIKTKASSSTALRINAVIGLFVGDGIDGNPYVMKKVETLKNNGIEAMTWKDLIASSKRTWKEFLAIIKTRSPDDERINML